MRTIGVVGLVLFGTCLAAPVDLDQEMACVKKLYIGMPKRDAVAALSSCVADPQKA